MKLSDFNYRYPKELVAQRPLPERDRSRMMVVDRKDGSRTHSTIECLPERLDEGDVIVINDSRVIPARLFGSRSGGEGIELLVVEPARHRESDTRSGEAAPDATGIWRCLLKRAKRIRSGEKLFFGMQSTGIARGRDGIFLLVEFRGKALKLAMEHHGVPPLPPYIEREGYEAYTDEDQERYQTVFASKSGSAAAPTAGLHLSNALLERISSKGVKIARVTLHVGIDTFAPVRKELLDSHRMHGERIEITEETACELMEAKRRGKRVVAVGTTSVRVLESAALQDVDGSSGFISWTGGRIHHGKWTTDLFIKPGFDFRMVDAMLTNFHQPKSTLLVLVSAFAGREFILDSYEEAIEEGYRLFSYGDCMLIS